MMNRWWRLFIGGAVILPGRARLTPVHSFSGSTAAAIPSTPAPVAPSAVSASTSLLTYILSLDFHLHPPLPHESPPLPSYPTIPCLRIPGTTPPPLHHHHEISSTHTRMTCIMYNTTTKKECIMSYSSSTYILHSFSFMNVHNRKGHKQSFIRILQLNSQNAPPELVTRT